jgi:hypothetical protein
LLGYPVPLPKTRCGADGTTPIAFCDFGGLHRTTALICAVLRDPFSAKAACAVPDATKRVDGAVSDQVDRQLLKFAVAR